jgi:hypothetical protein
MFDITMNKGFHMKFDNGFSVSVQWGSGNYCSNRASSVKFGDPVPASTTAEVAAFDPAGNLIHLSEGDGFVMGYMSADRVLAFMNAVSQLSPDDVPDQLLIAAD